jgi:chromosome segregation ATPase
VDLIHEEFSKSSKLIEELSALQKLHDEIQDKVVVALKDLSVSQGELFEANDKCDRLSNALTMIESKLSIKEEEAINLLSDNQYKAKLIEIDSNTIAQLNAELERFKYSAESAARVPSTVELSEALCANIDIKDRREIQIENSNLKEALAAREYDLQKAKDILEIGGTSIAKLREELLKLKKLYKTLKTEKSIAMNRVAELESILLIGNKASTDSIDIVATDLTGQLQSKLDSSYLQHIDAGEDENKDPTTSDPSSGTIFSSWW